MVYMTLYAKGTRTVANNCMAVYEGKDREGIGHGQALFRDLPDGSAEKTPVRTLSPGYESYHAPREGKTPYHAPSYTVALLHMGSQLCTPYICKLKPFF
jgi:hypothetical protein